MDIEISNLKLIIQERDKEIAELKEHLKKYTAPKRNIKYYEKNKDIILQKNKEYKKKTNYNKTVDAKKIKEYNKRAYLKRKNKIINNDDV